jgi:hypothetical protein
VLAVVEEEEEEEVVVSAAVGLRIDPGPQHPQACSATDSAGACATTAVMRGGLGTRGATLMAKRAVWARKRGCIDSTLELCPGRSLHQSARCLLARELLGKLLEAHIVTL